MTSGMTTHISTRMTKRVVIRMKTRTVTGPRPQRWRSSMGAWLSCTLCIAALLPHPVSAAAGSPAPVQAAPAALQALPALDLSTYTGTWYQVAWFPNRFQKQCVSDTTATYSRRADGAVDVLNRCKLADGSFDSAQGMARPAGATLTGDLLQPAQLEVSFLPAWLRWLPIWGDYWLIQRPEHGRYAVISEGSRQYLWVLARTPVLPADDLEVIRRRLLEQGFDLGAWQAHPHTLAPPAVDDGQSRRPATPPAAQTR